LPFGVPGPHKWDTAIIFQIGWQRIVWNVDAIVALGDWVRGAARIQATKVPPFFFLLKKNGKEDKGRAG